VPVVVVEVLSSEGMAQFVEFNSRSANGLKTKNINTKLLDLKFTIAAVATFDKFTSGRCFNENPLGNRRRRS
jgi:hypothetical protein